MSASRRKMLWLITEDGDAATLTVTHGGRSVATGLHSLEAAKDLVRVARRDGERVWLVETDGYRTELTKLFRDSPTAPPPRQTEIRRFPARPVLTRYLERYGRR